MSPDDLEPDKDPSLRAPRKKLIKKDKPAKNYKSFKLVWTRIQPILPVKNILILPGDCILPLNNISLFSLIQQLYTKNSSIRDSDHLELILTRKIKPFRSFEELFPLIRNICSQYVPQLKQLISKDYVQYIENKKIQRRLVSTESNTVVSKSSKDFDIALENYLQNLEEKYYRYQVRSSNEDKEMQMKKVGISKHLIKLLEPESTDILVRATPKIFKDINNYFKYMYYNLLSLIQGGSMNWVDIDLETEDEIVIETRFKNVYFSTPYSTKLVTITLFQISKNALTKVEEIRKQINLETDNVLGIINHEAEEFFNKFYQDKNQKKRERCLFSQIRRE